MNMRVHCAVRRLYNGHSGALLLRMCVRALNIQSIFLFLAHGV
jgi:hypothetical protein